MYCYHSEGLQGNSENIVNSCSCSNNSAENMSQDSFEMWHTTEETYFVHQEISYSKVCLDEKRVETRSLESGNWFE